MVRFTGIVTILVASLLVATISPLAMAADKIDPAEAPAKAVLTDMLLGLKRTDYKLYTRHFSAKLKKLFPRQSFFGIQKKLLGSVGEIEYAEYLGSIVWSGQTMSLFKGRFNKSKDDVLIRLALDLKGKPQVLGIWFNAPALK